MNGTDSAIWIHVLITLMYMLANQYMAVNQPGGSSGGGSMLPPE